MANLKFNVTVRNNRLTQISNAVGNSGILTIYSGTQPAGGGSVTTALVSCTCNSSGFAGTPSAGSMTLNAIASGTVSNSGTATWFRITTSGGSWVIDGDVSSTADGTGDLQLSSTSLVANGTVDLTGPNSFTDGNAA